MIEILLKYEDGRQAKVCASAPVHIGRDAGCAVRIRHWRVAKRHASIIVIGDTLALEDHGSLMGTAVNNRRIATHAPLLATDRVVIGPCLMQMRATGGAQVGTESHPLRGRSSQSSISRNASVPPNSTANVAVDITVEADDGDSAAESGDATIALASGDADIAFARCNADIAVAGCGSDCATEADSAEISVKASGAANHVFGNAVADDVRLSQSLVDDQTIASGVTVERLDEADPAAQCPVTRHAPRNAEESLMTPNTKTASLDSAARRAQDARDRSAHDALLQALDLRRHDVAAMSDATLRHVAGDLLMQILDEDRGACAQEKQARCRRVLDEVVGLGPLESLLEDDGVSEIMINRYDDIYVERAGRLHAAALRFTSEQALRRIIDRIVSRVGRRVDESMPMVDARLSDGSRVNAVLPPIALNGAVLTIRKFMRSRLGMSDLVRTGAMSTAMAAFLQRCVEHRASIVIAGGTGSGKTTLLNILADAIPPDERIVTIEDSAELRLRHMHLVALEARPPNVEGRGLITIRDLVRNALRMRPDRIVVGECRGAEAFDMLAAMNTGHEGSMTTLHANTPRDALARLETMIMMANMGLPLSVVREHVVSSVDLIVQQRRLANGRRVVTEIVELTGMESGCIQSQSLFRFSAASDGFAWGGVLPGIVQRWRDEGHVIDTAMFFSSTDSMRGMP